MQVQNNFNGGPDGTQLSTSNSGQYGDDAFTDVGNPVSGGTMVFANVATNNLNRPTAEYVFKVAVGSGATHPWVGWDSSKLGSNTQVWIRLYAYFGSVAQNAAGDMNFCSVYQGTSFNGASLWLRTDTSTKSVYIKNQSTGFATYTTTPVVAGVWNRIEWRVQFGSGTTGSSDLYWYSGDDVDTLNTTETLSQTAQNYGLTAIDVVTFGQDDGSQTNSAGPLYISNVLVSNTGNPGPAPFRQGLGYPVGNLTNPVAIHMI